jgi:hypothetical protein
MDDTQPQLPLLIRVGLRCHPNWWREHYGVDAASTAADLNREGASPSAQGVTLIISALSAHLRGPKALKQSATDAIVEAAEFNPSVVWRLLSFLALVFQLIGLGVLGFLVVTGISHVLDRGPAYLHRVSVTPVQVKFEVPRALVFFAATTLAIAFMVIELVILVRARPPRSTRAKVISTTALLVTIVGAVLTVLLALNLKYGHLSEFSFRFSRFGRPVEFLVGLGLLLVVLVAGWLIVRWNHPRRAQLAGSLVLALAMFGGVIWASGAIAGWQSGFDVGAHGFYGHSYDAGFWNASPSLTSLTSETENLTGPTPQCVKGTGCYLSGDLYYGNPSFVDSIVSGYADLISLVPSDGQLQVIAVIDNFSGSSMSCWSSTRCVLAGFVPTTDTEGYAATATTTNGWSSWTIHPIGSSVLQPVSSGAVSCVAGGHCLLAAQRQTCGSDCATSANPMSVVVLGSDDAGANWRPLSVFPSSTLPNSGPIVQNGILLCSDRRNCWFFSGGPQTQECPVATSCTYQASGLGSAQNSFAFRSTDGGSTWAQVKLPDLAPYVEYVNCVSNRRCNAISVGNLNDNPPTFFLTSLNGGNSWSVKKQLDSYLQYSQLYCKNTSDCWASGRNDSNGSVLATRNGGLTWSHNLLPTGNVVDAMGCTSSQFCVGTGALGSANRAKQDPLIRLTLNGWTTSSQVLPASPRRSRR